MFVEAIETAASFTRAVHTISRTYGSNVVRTGASTIFFVNADGFALTCAHVARYLFAGSQVTSVDELLALAPALGNEASDWECLEV